MKFLFPVLVLFSFNLLAQDSISSIAFGSCSHQDKPLPIFSLIDKHNPDLFIHLGDNIYGDTKNMCKLKHKYRKLARNRDYKNFRKHNKIIATWDDHDYGQDDAGKYYPKKSKSKKIFLRFFNEPKESLRWTHSGIYTSYYYHINGKILQIILLDNRTFRDNLLPYDGSLNPDTLKIENNGFVRYDYDLDYSPQMNPDSTILGMEQWKWLEGELRKPADIRIIGSSTQFSTEYNGYETWANFPLEQARMLQLITDTQAKGILFISGDVHYAEMSKLVNETTYPIYDLTASGLTEEWKFATPNVYRIGEPVMENHFGMININWTLEIPEISLEIWDEDNNLRIQQTVVLTELQ